MTTRRSADLADLGMKKAHNESVLLSAILSLGNPDEQTDTWAANRLRELCLLARQIIRDGTASHVARVTGVILTDDDDYALETRKKVEED
jgi:hypothetical protein